jgi:RNA polymerase sigma-70 factor, ECF subfamily
MPGGRTTALTDTELLQSTAAGDHDAYASFVDRHEAAVLRYLDALGLDRDTAGDVLQETFIAAWRNAAAFRGEATPRTWLLRIARHAAFREQRRHAGEPREHVSLDTLAREAGWGAARGERLDERLAARELLEAGFRLLDPDDREILVLRDLEQLTGEEAAATLGVSLAAQKSRLHRARLRFLAGVKGRMDA